VKIAIIGSTGLLGSNLLKLYSSLDVRGFSRNSSFNVEPSRNTVIDFDNLENELREIFKEWRPDLIVNAVANTNLKSCEDDYELAYKVNALHTKTLALISREFESYFIHISTDHYYNDEVKRHSEESEIVILNNYAKTKFIAEKFVLEANPSALVVRTNIIGFRKNSKPSFFEWLLNSLKNSADVSLFTDFFTSPISVIELGNILLLCKKSRLSGVYNIASSEVIDKYSFGEQVFTIFGFSSFNVKKETLQDSVIDGTQRALTLGLNIEKIENALGIKMPTIYETLNLLKREYEEKI
jgi:dTDP-4-dehydrorhamnose reductase